jgi:small neutral amino acid transporter SnatA (MarC family)
VGQEFILSDKTLMDMKKGGAKGIEKVFSLLLAAFAMMMIRMGLEGWLGLFHH